jgi:hypothetical protein
MTHYPYRFTDVTRVAALYCLAIFDLLPEKLGTLNIRFFWNFASSADFVGSFWLRNVAKLVIECDGNVFRVLETVHYSHGQFRFVVESFVYS